ncbi:MAG: NAD(+)/NADH kinase [Candidatus Verstraetearchaeota archaeon]|nr:NAD(+)/NADH kinase [Candidatus Verstraetearchaeota archaeon]
MKLEKVAVISRIDSLKAIKIAGNIVECLERRDIKVVLERSLALRLKSRSYRELEDLDSDILIIIGGDGTVLRTTYLNKREIPILTVNAGTVGFLSEVDWENFDKALDLILEDRFYLEECTRIKASIPGNGERDVLNEVAIVTGIPLKVVNLTVKRNGVEIFNGRCDGVIVSTRTGSTAYALSAGGPIIDPELDVFITVPLAPLKIYQRPVVFPSSAKVEVEVNRDGSNAIVILDGQEHLPAPVGTRILLEKSKRKTKFIRFKYNFYERLKKRLVKDV